MGLQVTIKLLPELPQLDHHQHYQQILYQLWNGANISLLHYMDGIMLIHTTRISSYNTTRTWGSCMMSNNS